MKLSKKIISICKTMQDEDLFSGINAGELHLSLCSKCQQFKVRDNFGKNRYWCKACKNLLVKKT
jgi:PHP family Zn ribbon phosphoesterase